MRKYKMIVYTMLSGDTVDYIAEYPALKGVSGVGSNPMEAITSLVEAAEINIAALIEAGLPVPEEDSLVKNQYSGKLSVRLSSTLHQKVAELAETEGVSINHCITEAVSMYVSSKLIESRIEDKIEEIYFYTALLNLKEPYSIGISNKIIAKSSRKLRESFGPKTSGELKYA